MVRRLLLVVAIAGSLHAAADDPMYRLALGTFSNEDNADRWARQVATALRLETEVQPIAHGSATGYRVVTQPLRGEALQQAIGIARAQRIEFWRLAEPTVARAGTPPEPAPIAAAPAAIPGPARVPATKPVAPAAETAEAAADEASFDVDVSAQTRSFIDSGLDGQSRFDTSISATARYYRSWDGERYNLAITPFGRFDDDDGKRTHADLREFYFSRIGDDWDLYAGFRQVFWGVTEFNHLIDIINQTDLVENIDGETKLGQPMLNLSLVRTWGILDFFVLPGFRERTFPGEDGRLRYIAPVDERDTKYESGDEKHHVDFAVRWAHNIGPVEFGLYQFSGTSRAPQLFPVTRPNGDIVLQPYYGLIDQTGLDAQAIFGDWAWKLEALSRSGQGDRYAAATGGFERTLVGVLGSRSDLGLVLEYIWDQRDDEADTIYDHDAAVALRWRLNDVSDSQALLGVMWDVRTAEYFVNLEASRRLGDGWLLALQGRGFGGTKTPPTEPPSAVLEVLLDDEHKIDQLARDDYIQLELTRFF
jgi:hypothetical protein